MTARTLFQRLGQQEDLNFLLTNRIPRRLLTHWFGWFSQREQPLIRDLSIAALGFFSDLELEDAARREFRSLHDCFTRELKPGARPIDRDPAVLVSPCDGIIGECGRIRGDELLQAKGYPYRLGELLVDPALIRRYRDGRYVTLRLTAGMYHRFHAPHDLTMRPVTYISGDTWNVNPIALRRIEKLFCKNERVVMPADLPAALGGGTITLVAVAAVLVASVRLRFADVLLHLRHRGPNVIPCAAQVAKGEELGYFQHGSTILVFAPDHFELCDGVTTGQRIRMGRPLLRLAPG